MPTQAYSRSPPRKAASRASGFQAGGNGLKPLKDMGSVQHLMTVPIVRVGQGWTEARTLGGGGREGALPMF